MARRGFFSRLFGVVERAVSPMAREKQRDKEERDYRRGKMVSGRVARRAAERARAKAADRANIKEQTKRRARERARERREDERRNPYRQTWEREQPGKRFQRKNFEGNKRFFDDLPGMDQETDEDKQELWQSYVENMVFGRSGYRYNDLRNPWWDDSNMHPNQFDWDEWRKWRKTP